MLASKVNKVRPNLETQDIPAFIGKYRLSMTMTRYQKKYLLISNEQPTLEDMELSIIKIFNDLKNKGYEEINITVSFREVGTGLIIHRTKHFNLTNIDQYPENPAISMLVDLFKLSLIEASPGNYELAIAKSSKELKESLATFTKKVDLEEVEVSDMYTGNEDYILDTSIFSVSVKNLGAGRTTPPGALNNDRNHTILIKDTFKVRNYNVKNNNCLIDCFIRFAKDQLDNAPYKQAKTIKKNLLNLEEDDELDISIHTKILEHYFNKTCGVISCSTEVLTFTHGVKSGKTRFYNNNIELFTCSISYNDTFIYGNEDSDFWVYYDADNNHVYPIASRFSNNRCKHTGATIPTGKKELTRSEILYHLIKQNRIDPPDTTKPKKSKTAKKQKPYFMCIDFETIYDNFGTLSAYSASAYGFISNEEWSSELANGRIDTSENNLKIFYSIGEKCDIELYQFIIEQKNKIYKELEEYNKTVATETDLLRPELIILTWNGSRFDNFILTKTLSVVNALDTNSVFIAKNSILGLKFNGIKCIDLCRFITRPLAEVCEPFKIVNKKVDMGKLLSHEIIQTRYFQSNCNINSFINLFSEDDLHKMEYYNKMDCIAVIEIYFKFEQAFNTIFQVLQDKKVITNKYNIFDSYTMPSLTYKLFSDYLDTHKIDVPIPKTQEDWLFFKSCIIGGRAQAFRTGKFEGKFVSLDVKSLYPFAMIEGFFPLGDYIRVSNGEGWDDITKMGYYNCKISNQPTTKIIPARTEEGTLDWTYEGEINMPLSSVDIKVLKDYGATVDIGDGFLYNQVSNTIFSTFINVFKDEKTKQDVLKANRSLEYNEVIRETCKLVMNSLAGKTQQAIFLDNGTIVSSANDALKFIANHNKVIIKEICNSAAVFIKGEKKLLTSEAKAKHYESQAYPIQLGVLVYSYSREHMYRSILSKINTKFYTDTDSVHINLNENDVKELLASTAEVDESKPILGNFAIGKEFGHFENEIPLCTKGYYASPKCYALFADIDNLGSKLSSGVFGKLNFPLSKTTKEKIEPYKKMRFKGINLRDKSLLSMNTYSFDEKDKDGRPIRKVEGEDKIKLLVEKIKKTREEMTRACFDLYNNLPSAYSEDTFNDIVEHKEAYILCSSIKKHTFQQTDNLFDLSARFIVKKVTIKDIPAGATHNPVLNIEPLIGSITEEKILD